MKVIFLDFDGVLTTAHTRYNTGDPWCAYWLRRLIEETDAKVVVSSMWRIGRTVEELQALLNEWDCGATVIDRTPVDHMVIRGVEIERWLETNKHLNVESYVILDDDSDMGQLIPRLVLSNTRHGFDEKDYYKAKRLLTITDTNQIVEKSTEEVLNPSIYCAPVGDVTKVNT